MLFSFTSFHRRVLPQPSPSGPHRGWRRVLGSGDLDGLVREFRANGEMYEKHIPDIPGPSSVLAGLAYTTQNLQYGHPARMVQVFCYVTIYLLKLDRQTISKNIKIALTMIPRK